MCISCVYVCIFFQGGHNSESTQHYVETPSLAQKLFIVAMNREAARSARKRGEDLGL